MVQNAVDPRACLALVERSPAAVAVHDKQAWLELFARYSVVEDPVGSRPCVSRPGDDRATGALSRFYDTFIAPNDIHFNTLRDFVGGASVVRDLSLEITMAGGARVITPMHLLYEVVEEKGELKIFRLAAHWELRSTLQQRSAGLDAFWRMLKFLGPSGVYGFMRALSTVGDHGKSRVQQFVQAFNARRGEELQGAFASPAASVQLCNSGDRIAPINLLELGDELVLGKILAAGDCISASVELVRGSGRVRGVAFFYFDRRSLLLKDLHLYLEN